MQIHSIKDIAKLVRKKRKALNFTQELLAELSNVGTRFISDLENAKPTCQVEKVLKVLKNLGITLETNYD